MDFRKLKLIIAALLLLAILDLPYGYYTFLRIVVSIAAGIIALNSYEDEDSDLWFFYAGVAALFNPIIPVYLPKELWIVLDVIIAACFGVSAFVRR